MIGAFVRTEDEIPELRDVLSRRVPRRDWSPGVEMAYSNYGSALAGYIVEVVSQMPYADYVTRNILMPLKMTNSSVHLPPSDVFYRENKVAKGYVWVDDDGDYAEFGNEFLTIAPAGTLQMSSNDAARFMSAYLGDGSYDGNRILMPETVELMRSTTLFTNHPSLPGNAYGFWESSRHGQRILQHYGDVSAFAAHLAIIPDYGIGYYVTTNSKGGLSLRSELWEAFLDTFFPIPPPEINLDVTEGQVGNLALPYTSNRRSSSSLGKIEGLFSILTFSQTVSQTLSTSVAGLEFNLVPIKDNGDNASDFVVGDVR